MRTRSYGSVTIYYPDLDREEVISRLRTGAKRLAERLPLERVVLIGSYATDRHTASSDVDVLVVYRDPPREDAWRVVLDAFDIPGLEPHVYSAGQAERMARPIGLMEREGRVVIYPT